MSGELQPMQTSDTTLNEQVGTSLTGGGDRMPLREQISGLDREELLSQGYLEADEFPTDEKIVSLSYYFTPEELALDEEF
jgi:hypothetical protein